MRRDLFSLLAALAITSTFLTAQTPAPAQAPAAPDADRVQSAQPRPAPAQGAQAAPDTTLTGCLVQGSGPNVFILENAKTSTAAATDKGKSYILAAAPGTASVDFRAQLNRQVRIVGLADDKAASMPSAAVSGASNAASSTASVKIDEKDMPKLSARTVARVGDTCPTVG